MALTCKGIYVIGAKRTPFCKYGGALREMPAAHVFAAAAKDAIYSASLDPAVVDCTVVGNVNFLSQCDGGKTPRYCGLYAGVPIEKPALGVNKACGSGLQAILTGALDILTGSATVCLTGGTELMSSLPLLVRNVRFGTTLGKSYQLEDHIKNQLIDSITGLSLPKIAEDLGLKYGITREVADQYVLESHKKWKAAQDANVFEDELTSLTVTVKKKEILIDKDDLSMNVDADYLAKLPRILDNGILVTSGNSSAPADGASALILANEESIKAHNLAPLARVTGWARVGVDPADTGLAAVQAVRKLLEVTRVDVKDVDLFEVNETFAPQLLATVQELKIEQDKVNASGGDLAVGHPVAATGARMATHLVHQLNRRNGKRGIAASSCGGGQGVAVMFENV